MLTIIFYIVGLTTLISFFYYKKFNNSIYKYFLYYLLWTFMVELTYNIARIRYFETKEYVFNYFISYNIHLIISYLFYFYFYRKLSKNKKNKKIFLYFSYVFGCFALINYFVLNQNLMDELNVHNLIVGSILLLITIILFLIEIINNENIVFNIHKSFIFWISLGLLLFYIGILPIMISTKYLNYNITYMSILNSLNAIMYGSFIIGMIKSDSKFNY